MIIIKSRLNFEKIKKVTLVFVFFIIFLLILISFFITKISMIEIMRPNSIEKVEIIFLSKRIKNGKYYNSKELLTIDDYDFLHKIEYFLTLPKEEYQQSKKYFEEVIKMNLFTQHFKYNLNLKKDNDWERIYYKIKVHGNIFSAKTYNCYMAENFMEEIFNYIEKKYTY